MVRKAVFNISFMEPYELGRNTVRGIKSSHVVAGFNVRCLVHHTACRVNLKIKIIANRHVDGKRTRRRLPRGIVNGNFNIFRTGTADLLGTPDTGKHFGRDQARLFQKVNMEGGRRNRNL